VIYILKLEMAWKRIVNEIISIDKIFKVTGFSLLSLEDVKN